MYSPAIKYFTNAVFIIIILYFNNIKNILIRNILRAIYDVFYLFLEFVFALQILNEKQKRQCVLFFICFDVNYLKLYHLIMIHRLLQTKYYQLL